MVETEALFRIGDAAEEAGNYELARQSFARGAALGDERCLTRLALLFDTGIGVPVDRAFAMRCYRQAWRLWRSDVAANNIAVLYREAGNRTSMFRWFQRAALQGDGDALFELGKCYLNGVGVRKSAREAMSKLSAAVASTNITEAGREEAASLLATHWPNVAICKGA